MHSSTRVKAQIIKTRITKSAVDRLIPGQTLRDTQLIGFGVRCQSGRASYFVQKKVHGRLTWLTIGQHGAPWTVETARAEGARLLLMMVTGSDPRSEKAAKKRRAETISDATQRFLIEHGRKLKPRTLSEYRRLFDLFLLPRFGRRGLLEVARADVSKMHSDLGSTPSQANFALTALSAFYSWAEAKALAPPNSNPCRGVIRYRHRKMERYLTPDELQRLGQTLNQLEAENRADPFALAAIRLLILTGARRNEILTLQWRDVDLRRHLLILRDSKTGEKVIHLNEPAVQVLQTISRLAGNPYVIVGRVHGTHMVNIHKIWDQIRKEAGLEDVRIHDLRHSFASLAAETGASLPMIGKLLGHSQPRTTQRYAHLTEHTVHDLNERIGASISAWMPPRP